MPSPKTEVWEAYTRLDDPGRIFRDCLTKRSPMCPIITNKFIVDENTKNGKLTLTITPVAEDLTGIDIKVVFSNKDFYVSSAVNRRIVIKHVQLGV